MTDLQAAYTRFAHLFFIWLACVLLGPASSGMADKKTNDWGDLTGTVLFEGDLESAAVTERQTDLPIYGPISLRDSMNGKRRRQIASVPNQSLLIDAETQGLKNAFVYLRLAPDRIHPTLRESPAAPAKLTTANHQTSPRSLIVRSGQELQLVNSGRESISLRCEGIASSDFNRLVRPQESQTFQLAKNGRITIPSRIKNQIISAPVAHLLVTDHPYATITDQQGQFELKNLPAGEHELSIWHESAGWIAKGLPITITADETTTLRRSLTTQSITRLPEA